MAPQRTQRLTPAELTSWRAFLRAHATITRALEADLVATHGMSLAAYDVLVQLVEAEGHRLRMTELAEAVLLSRSGVTRLVDRLERDGLVSRGRVQGDGRGVSAALTERGYERLRAAAGTHLGGVKRHFAGPLSDRELSDIGGACHKLGAHAAVAAAGTGGEPGEPALPGSS